MRRPARVLLAAAGRIGRALSAPRRRVAAERLVAAGAVDTAFVELQSGRREGDVRAAARWYLAQGRVGGAAPHPLVEPAWIDPSGWRTARRDPVLTLLSGGKGTTSAHPLLPPGPPGLDMLRGLAPETVLVGGTTYADWRDAVEQAQTVLSRETGLAGRRVRTSWDTAADAAYVARWKDAPGPAGDGPWVSVVMPVRDRPRLVAEAIASVQRQTTGRWQLIVVDDGSTDSTPDVVQALADTDPRIRLLRRPHAGVCAARNAGIDAAEAGYLAFLDSDNEWTPHFLQVAIAAMHASGIDVAHAVVDEVGEHGHRYRAFAGQERHLWLGNFVDLNVLVTRTEAVRDIGGFAPELRRMVDYDLVWRLAKRHELHLLPFVGVRYAHADDPDRITRTESFAWDDVVKARNMVDWERLRRDAGQRDPRLLSVVVPLRLERASAVATVRSVLEAVPSGFGGGVEVVVADNGSSAPDWRLLRAEVGMDPRVRLVRSPVDLHRAAATSLALAETRGGTVLIMPAGVEMDAAAVQALLEPLDEPDVVAALPRDWAMSAVIAVRASSLVSARGLDPLFVNELELADLALRLRAQGGVVVETPARTRLVRAYPSPTDRQHAENMREWGRRWPEAAPARRMEPA